MARFSMRGAMGPWWVVALAVFSAPPLASQQVDYAALEIVNAWINTLPACD